MRFNYSHATHILCNFKVCVRDYNITIAIINLHDKLIEIHGNDYRDMTTKEFEEFPLDEIITQLGLHTFSLLSLIIELMMLLRHQMAGLPRY